MGPDKRKQEQQPSNDNLAEIIFNFLLWQIQEIKKKFDALSSTKF